MLKCALLSSFFSLFREQLCEDTKPDRFQLLCYEGSRMSDRHERMSASNCAYTRHRYQFLVQPVKRVSSNMECPSV